MPARRLVPLLLTVLTAVMMVGCTRAVNYAAATAPRTLHVPDAAPPAAEPDTLRVVTFNIQYGRLVEQAVAELLANPALRAPDVLLLQEMDGPGVQRIAQALGLHAAYIPASIHNRTGVDFGNAVLSRWPLRDVRGIDLPGVQPYNGQTRMAVAATVDAPGGPLRCLSLHLEVPTMGTEFRRAQLRAAVDAVVGFDGPVLLGGDFNTVVDYDARELGRVLRRARFHEATGQPDTARRGLPFWKFQAGVLDRVFGRGLAPVRAGAPAATAASDHVPVWTLWVRDPS